MYAIAFPTVRNSATFWDKGTEVPSLSRDKGTIGQAQNLPWDGMGWDSLSKAGTGHGTGQSLFFCQNPGRDTGPDRTITIFFYDFLF